MPTTSTRANAKRRQPQAGAPARRTKAMLSDARRAGKVGKKAETVEELSGLTIPSPSPHSTRASSPSPTVKVVGFDAPDCSPVVPTTPADGLRKKQSADFWAVIEGRLPRAPVLRKAASFAGYPIAPTSVTGLGITLASSPVHSTTSTSASPVASTSRLPAPAPTLRKAASFLGYLLSAPKPSTTAISSPLAVSLLRKASCGPASLKASASTVISTDGLDKTRPPSAFTSASSSSAAVAALRRVASSAAIGSSTRQAASKPTSSPATTVVSSPTRTAWYFSAFAAPSHRRPSSPSQRLASSLATARPLRRMISYDSVTSTSSADDFQFDLAGALNTSDYGSDLETLVDSDSAIDDDDSDGSEWETASTCAGSPSISACSF